MAPPSRRRILPAESLAAFGAVHLYPLQSNISHGDGSLRAASAAIAPDIKPSLALQTPSSVMLMAASTPSSSPPGPVGDASTSSNEIEPSNGIEICGWKITTRNSTIGDEKGMDELTLLLEETANKELVVDGQNDSMMKSDYNGARRRKRRLCPPEITFLDAIISFQYQNETVGEEERMAEIRFTARDALLEWAEAHRYLEMQNGNTQCSTSSPTDEYRGVSVKRTVDAKIWSNKSQNNIDATATAASNSEFYYDWTFSSPYAGTIRCPQIDNPTDILGKGCDVNNRGLWKPLQQSHIPFHLLQDTSQPILLYDDIHLYEDDLHDNGDVSLNIKVRVMPRCWYVLQRLFVRVDRVCVKCREVRYFCMLDDSSISSSGGSNEVDNAQVNTIYRDVVWREAAWEELGRLALPMDPAAWREDGNGVVGGTTAARPGMLSPPPPLASMLTRLPVVSLPSDLSRFAYFHARWNNE